MKRSTIEASLGVIVTGLMLVCASLTARAAAPITLQPGESVTITAAQGGTTPPPANVQCPDGSIHPPGYVCPVTPPSNGCTGFANTRYVTLDWANPVRMYSSGFGQNDALVIKFTTGSVPSPDTYMPAVAAAEWGSPTQSRYAVLSATACDFSNQQFYGAVSSGTSITSIFTVANANNYGYYPILKANTTYYLNIKNIAPLACGNACDMFVELQKAGGT